MSGRGERKKDTVLVPDSCCEDLANAIVVQAVDDYLAAHNVLQDVDRHDALRKAAREVVEADYGKQTGMATDNSGGAGK